MKDRADVAAEILKRIEGIETPHVVEVGVEVGKLSATLLSARPDLVLYMVDNWAPKARQPFSYIETGDPSAQKTKIEQVQREDEARSVAGNYPGRAFIVKDDSVHAAARFKNSIFDLVFIDADHSFEGVCADVEAWRNKIVSGGWIGGHDYDNPTPVSDMSGVKAAVDHEFEGRVEIGADYTWFVQRL